MEPDESKSIITIGGTVREMMSRSPAWARASSACANVSAIASAPRTMSERVCRFMFNLF